ncbi:hypothetical protein EW146_g4132 [Bondarzewia mesenterica]|uniref:Aminotransferase class I/classII large domain-containing protein n=1 Tax=Bondarzewia mesenterica TaxID=1095465 RepID=A0A4V3XF83_9AGAM|nr:hypothetical protein EW146_g4132 [Bondarzewia mesenterica]
MSSPLHAAIEKAILGHFLDKLSQTNLVLGSGGSRLTSGNCRPHVELEAEMKDYFRYPAALLCNSGFEANVSFFHSVPQSGDAVIFDEYLHASARDGMAASRANRALYPFTHNSVSSLRECIVNVLQRHPNIAAGKGTVYVGVESLYSMDGDFAPLPQIVQVVEELIPKGSAHIFVDEAHSTGIYERDGRGLVALLGLEDKVDTVLHTFGKARAAFGAALLTSHLIKTYIINYARPHIYTTSLPHADILALNTTFDYISSPAGAELRERLQRLSKYFSRRLTEALKQVPAELLALPVEVQHPGFPVGLASPMHPILTPAPVSLQNYLRKLGYSARAIPYPVVPKGQERMRVTVHARNSEKEVDEFIVHLLNWAKTMQAVSPATNEVQAKL